MIGVLNVDKPSGITSHDVVQRVRRLLSEERIGHTGTLDPLATGVLVLCLGKATRIARYLEAAEKEYTAEMQLGIVTDTLDAEGRILETTRYATPDRTRVLEVLKGFTGQLMQTPPLYSAIKVGGVASYKLARQGKAAPLMPRPVVVHALELLNYSDPFITVRVRCSKGTYIRSLCSEIGGALGMGAHMTNLKRTASGSFRIEHSVTLDQLMQAASQGNIDRLIISLDRALEDVPLVILNEDQSRRIVHGARITAEESGFVFDGNLVRIHDHRGMLLALGSMQNGVLSPVTVFAGADGL